MMKEGERQDKEQTPGSGRQQEVGLTEDGIDLVRVQGIALRLKCRPTTPPTSQVTVHQGVHIKHTHQQRPGHGRGRLCLIGCLPRADVTKHPRTWIHLHLAHLETSIADSAPPPSTGNNLNQPIPVETGSSLSKGGAYMSAGGGALAFGAAPPQLLHVGLAA